jgi:hypothetical protein
MQGTRGWGGKWTRPSRGGASRAGQRGCMNSVGGGAEAERGRTNSRASWGERKQRTHTYSHNTCHSHSHGLGMSVPVLLGLRLTYPHPCGTSGRTSQRCTLSGPLYVRVSCCMAACKGPFQFSCMQGSCNLRNTPHVCRHPQASASASCMPANLCLLALLG